MVQKIIFLHFRKNFRTCKGFLINEINILMQKFFQSEKSMILIYADISSMQNFCKNINDAKLFSIREIIIFKFYKNFQTCKNFKYVKIFKYEKSKFRISTKTFNYANFLLIRKSLYFINGKISLRKSRSLFNIAKISTYRTILQKFYLCKYAKTS